MKQLLKFEGRVGTYELTLLVNRQTIQFRYYQEHEATIVYEAFFYRQAVGSTDPTVARQIIEVCKNFKSLFQYIKDFSENQSRISIANAGIVKINWFKRNVGFSKKTIKIEFEGKRMMSEAQIRLEKKVRSEVIDARAENAYLKETLAKLESRCRAENTLIQRFKTKILLNKQYKLKQLKADARMLEKDENRHKNKDAIRIIAQNISEIRQTLKELIQKVEKPLQLPSPDHSDEEGDFETLQKYGMRHWIYFDYNNKFLNSHFEIDGNTLKKVRTYFSCQVLGRDPIPLSGRHFFSVFIDKITASIFSIGIVAQSRRNYQKSVEDKDCIAFYGRNGTVWQDGIERGGGPTVPNGVEIRVVVDWLKDMVKWYQDGTEIASTMIGERLREKRIVAYLQLNYVNDRVTVNHQLKKDQNVIVRQKVKQ